jgi:hypothetical protein
MNSIPREHQIIFELGLLANVASVEVGPDLPGLLRRRIADSLIEGEGDLGRWELCWGPAVLQLIGEGPLQNAMYMVQSADDPTLYVAAIAGTNPISPFDWLVEDLFVSTLLPWVYDLFRAPEARISFGAATGLVALQAMRPEPGSPGAGMTLAGFLRAVAARGPARLIIAGHSLGGALASTVALWLHSTQGGVLGWDPQGRVEISTFSTAAPTAGNAAFAALHDERLGARTTRYANDLDVVPLAWTEATLREVASLYTPDIPTDAAVTALMHTAARVASGGDYTQIVASAVPIVGEINPAIISPGSATESYFRQLVYQHILSYAGLFAPGEHPTAVQRLLDLAAAPGAILGKFSSGVLRSALGARVMDEPPPSSMVPLGQEWVEVPEDDQDPRSVRIRARLTELMEKAGAS